MKVNGKNYTSIWLEDNNKVLLLTKDGYLITLK
jgi:hypothetical protein